MKIAWQLWLPWQRFMNNFRWHFLWKYWASYNKSFIFSIYVIVIQNLANKVMIQNSRWPPCLYMEKAFKWLLLQNCWANLADILHEAYAAPSYIKQLKSFRLGHKQTLSIHVIFSSSQIGRFGISQREIGVSDREILLCGTNISNISKILALLTLLKINFFILGCHNPIIQLSSWTAIQSKRITGGHLT